jgi:hypothetical protein
MVKYSVSQFYITDENLAKFGRWVKKPMDCVINALEIIGILEKNSADLMRIAVGDVGLQIFQIEEIFKYMYPNFSWQFYRYTNIQTLENFCIHELQPSRVIFCGYNMKGFKHVFLIGKTNNNQILYIDPQVNGLCDLQQAGCFSYIQNAEEYYILQGTTTAQQNLQIQAQMQL